jgi:hypothetical protein
MNTVSALLGRLVSRRLQVPAAILIAFLQRSPIARIVQPVEQFLSEPPNGFALKAAVASAASLGAVHTLAGATTYALVSTQQSPVTATVNKPIASIAFTVSNTLSTGSWKIAGQIPPGLTFSAVEGGNTLTSPGILDATTAGTSSSDPYSPSSPGNAQTTPLLTGTPNQPGTYAISLTAYEFGGATGLVSPTFTFTITVVAAVTAPTISTQPQSQTVNSGTTVTFTVAASDPSATIQWLKNGSAIAGATSATLTLANVQSTDAGSYTATATNAAGSATSSAAILTVNSVAKPSFTVPPASQTVLSGGTVAFNATVTGSPAPTYQWQFNGANIAGATNSRYVTSAIASNAGSYTVVATNSQGSTVSAAAVLTVSTTTNPGRLGNLSVNAVIPAGQSLTLGFVDGGSGTSGSQTLLIRGMGPTLQTLGVGGALPDPTLNVLQGQTSVGSNGGWGTPAANQAAVVAADAATGAFSPSSTTSHDAALVSTLAPSAYTVVVKSSSGASGTVVAEVYDDTASFAPTSTRLVNLSCNFQVSAGGTLTGGFIILGSTSKTVLIRASGPALQALGVSGTMPDPQIALHSTVNGKDTVLASNAGWGGDPQIATAASNVFAFAFPSASSKDSAILITLPPGAYTAQASSVSGTAGVTLIEVYEVP